MNGTATRAQKKDYNNWYKLTIHFSTHDNVDVTEEFFDSLCAPFGIIGDTIIRAHQRSHTPHFVLSGYGVVFFQEQPGANRALQALHGQVVQGLHLSCTLSPRPNDVLHMQQSQRGLHHLSVGHPSPFGHPSVPSAAPYGDVFRGSPRHHQSAIQQTSASPSPFLHSTTTTHMAHVRVGTASSPRHFSSAHTAAARHPSAHDSAVSAVAAYLAAQQQPQPQPQPQHPQSQQQYAQQVFQHLQLKQIDTSAGHGSYGLDYDVRPPSGSSSPIPPHQSAARHPALASYQQQMQQQQRMKQLMAHYMAPLPTTPAPPVSSHSVRAAPSQVGRHGASPAPPTHVADDRFSLAPMGSTAGMLTSSIASLASLAPASSSVFSGEAYFASPPPLTSIPTAVSSTSGSFSSGATTALGHSSGSLSASSAVTAGAGPSFPALYTSKQPPSAAMPPSASLSSSFSSQPSHSSSQLHFQQMLEGRGAQAAAASQQKAAALTSLDQLLDAAAGVTLVDDTDAALSNPSSFYVPRGEAAPYAHHGRQLQAARHALQQAELASHSQSAADLVSTLLASNSFSADHLPGTAGPALTDGEIAVLNRRDGENGSTLDSIIDEDAAVASSDY